MLILILSLTGIAIVYIVLNRQKGTGWDGQQDRLQKIESQLLDITRRLENIETIATSASFRVDQEFENLKNER